MGKQKVDAMNMLVLTLPGIGVTYYGEEIGQEDQWLSWKDTVDPAACNSNPKIYEKVQSILAVALLCRITFECRILCRFNF